MQKPPDPERGRSTISTACPLDCPDSCSLNVELAGGRIVKIDGSAQQPVTRGYICAKVRRFHDRVYGAARLLYPAVRKGPKGRGLFERVSWDEALDRIATRLAEARDRWGGESILPLSYGGSNGLLTQDTADAELFRRLGASQLLRTVCAAPTGAASLAMYGKMPGVTYADYPDARLIVIWGANPSTSGIHLVPYVREAQRRGAALVVIDPRRTRLAGLADIHLAVRPGTDLPVALAVHRHLFESGAADSSFLARHTTGAERLRAAADAWSIERAATEAGIDPPALQQFAELYARTTPAVIRCGWGLERNRNGGHAVLAVLALPAVAGKFGVRGGGYTMSNSASWGLSSARWIDAPGQDTRAINMNRLGRLLQDGGHPPLKVLFVYNCNPVATLPDQNRVIGGLGREDLFTVVFDQVLTDTAMYADVVLPATTFLETYDIARGYGPISLQLVRPVIEPVGESRANPEVFGALSGRLRLEAPDVDDDLDTLLRVTGTMPEAMREALLAGDLPAPPMGAAPVQFVDVFPRTTDGRVHLHPESLEAQATSGLYGYQPDPATAEYPLALVSPASTKTISSTLGELRARMAQLVVHPRDAAGRWIADGDAVRVFNGRGEVQCFARVSDDIAEGTVSLPKGLWRRHTLNASTSNALVPDDLTDLGGGACFNDARVEIAKIVEARFGDHRLALYVPTGSERTH